MVSAGKLWDDNNFVYYKMDPFCKEIVQVLVTEEDDGSDVRIVRFWEETWEKKEVGPNGHARLEARIVRKYSGLQWLDPDNTVNSYSHRTTHPDQVYFEKKRGNNRYHIFALRDGYDLNLAAEKQGQLWDIWDMRMMGEELYGQLYDFYSKDTKYDKKFWVFREEDDCDNKPGDFEKYFYVNDTSTTNIYAYTFGTTSTSLQNKSNSLQNNQTTPPINQCVLYIDFYSKDTKYEKKFRVFREQDDCDSKAEDFEEYFYVNYTSTTNIYAYAFGTTSTSLQNKPTSLSNNLTTPLIKQCALCIDYNGLTKYKR